MCEAAGLAAGDEVTLISEFRRRRAHGARVPHRAVRNTGGLRRVLLPRDQRADSARARCRGQQHAGVQVRRDPVGVERRRFGVESPAGVPSGTPFSTGNWIERRDRAMPVITLPDGSQKQYDAPVSVAQVAADIGPGLAKAALAGRVDGRLVDTAYAIDCRQRARDRHGKGRGRPGDHSALDRAPARPGRAAIVSGSAGHDRPGDRERLLLRLRVRAGVHAGGSRSDRGEDARARGCGSAGAAQGHEARRGRRVLQGYRRALQGGDHREHSRPTTRSACTGRATGSICAAARTCPAPAR